MLQEKARPLNRPTSPSEVFFSHDQACHKRASALIDLADECINRAEDREGGSALFQKAIAHLDMARVWASQIVNARLQVPLCETLVFRYVDLYELGYLSNLNNAKNTAMLAWNGKTTSRLLKHVSVIYAEGVEDRKQASHQVASFSPKDKVVLDFYGEKVDGVVMGPVTALRRMPTDEVRYYVSVGPTERTILKFARTLQRRSDS